MDDRGLVERFKAGDETAFDELVRRYEPEAYRLAYRFTHNSEDARDLAQEGFIRAYQGLSRFRGDASFHTWFYRIMTNLGYRYWRERAKRAKIIPLEPRREPDPVEVQHQRALRAAIDEAISALPPKQRMAFVLHYNEDLPYWRVAQALGCSEGAAKANYAQALKKLRKSLKRWL
jgi:RNA polymerase sigma-70 factor (ECF subfamily)